MIARVRDWLTGGPLYITARESELRLRHVLAATETVVEPLVAIREQGGGMIVGIGQDAKQAATRLPNTVVVNPFSHPRSLLGDFLVAEKLLRQLIIDLYGHRILRPAPMIVFQPLEKLEGGLTTVEERAFKELCAGAGGREVHVWTGRPLSDQEVVAGTFKDLGGHH